MKLASVVSDKQGLLKYINSKRRSKENIGLIFVVDDHLTNWSEEKVGACSSFFALVSYNTDRPWAALSSDLEDCYWVNNDFMFVYMEIVRDQLNVCKSMRPGGIHPRVLKELQL